MHFDEERLPVSIALSAHTASNSTRAMALCQRSHGKAALSDQYESCHHALGIYEGVNRP
jgi:hypothetical protein